MKKINIIIIILLIIPFQLKAQRQQVIEPTNLECWYSLVVIRDTIDRSLKIDDTMILGEFYQFNLSSCIRQQNSLTAQFVSFSLSNLANIFYPPIFTIINLCLL